MNCDKAIGESYNNERYNDHTALASSLKSTATGWAPLILPVGSDFGLIEAYAQLFAGYASESEFQTGVAHFRR